MHPESSQSEWARMLGITPGRVSQLLRLWREQSVVDVCYVAPVVVRDFLGRIY